MQLNFVRNFLVKSIRFNRSKMLSMLLAICGCGFLWSPLPAFATISQLEEYPGQMLYQSRQTLQDQTGKSWQAIVFKRVHPEGTDTVSLRLIGFLGAMEFDHTHIACLKRFSDRVRDSNCNDPRVANTFGPLTNPKK